MKEPDSTQTAAMEGWLLPLASAGTSRRTSGKRVGGKALGLGRLVRDGFQVPLGWVIDARTFTRLVEEELPKSHDLASVMKIANTKLGVDRAARARERLLAVKLPDGLVAAIEALWAFTEHDAPWGFAVRSSATCEDADETSLAGLASTVLGARGPEEMLQAIREVYASAYLPRALMYLAQADVRDAAMAVVLQITVPCEAAGVLFTAPPPGLEGPTWARHERLVHATWGLGAPVVEGAATSDAVRFSRAEGAVVATVIAEKRRALDRRRARRHRGRRRGRVREQTVALHDHGERPLEDRRAPRARWPRPVRRRVRDRGALRRSFLARRKTSAPRCRSVRGRAQDLAPPGAPPHRRRLPRGRRRRHRVVARERRRGPPRRRDAAHVERRHQLRGQGFPRGVRRARVPRPEGRRPVRQRARTLLPEPQRVHEGGRAGARPLALRAAARRERRRQRIDRRRLEPPDPGHAPHLVLPSSAAHRAAPPRAAAPPRGRGRGVRARGRGAASIARRHGPLAPPRRRPRHHVARRAPPPRSHGHAHAPLRFCVPRVAPRAAHDPLRDRRPSRRRAPLAGLLRRRALTLPARTRRASSTSRRPSRARRRTSTARAPASSSSASPRTFAAIPPRARPSSTATSPPSPISRMAPVAPRSSVSS